MIEKPTSPEINLSPDPVRNADGSVKHPGLDNHGMGSIFDVEHIELGKRFVVKVLLPQFAQRSDLVARLRNEWRALGRLEHRNIVAATDAGDTADGTPFFVMERLEGEPLSRRLRREGR